MKIPELVYEIRNLARKEEDPVKKDLFFQCAKSLEVLGNLAKISDLAVAEYKNCKEVNPIELDGNFKYYVDQVTLDMLDEHIDALIHYGFLSNDDRWPYGNNEIVKFTPKYLKSQIVKDSSIE
jgi:hypothetical protein